MVKPTRVDAPGLTQAERIKIDPRGGVLYIVGKMLDGLAKGNDNHAPWTRTQLEAAHTYLKELIYGSMGDISALTNDQREIVRMRFTAICHARIKAVNGMKLPGQAQPWYEEMAERIDQRKRARSARQRS